MAIHIPDCYRIYLGRKQKNDETKSSKWKFTSELKNNHRFSFCSINIYNLHLCDTFPGAKVRKDRKGGCSGFLLKSSGTHTEKWLSIEKRELGFRFQGSDFPQALAFEAGFPAQVSWTQMSGFQKLLCTATMRLCTVFT